MSFWRTSRTTAVPGSITPHARRHAQPSATATGSAPASAAPSSTSSSSSSSSSTGSSGILSTLAKTLSQTPVSTAGARPSFTSSVCAASEGAPPASSSPSPSSPPPQTGAADADAASAARVARFERVLAEPLVSIDALRRLAWRGVPAALRPLVWKLLLGIVPLSRARRAEVLASKRAEYRGNVPTFMGAEKSDAECGTLHQIAIDLPRTAPGVAPFACPRVRALQERVLYIWALLHPASGYVQGLNELLTPIVLVLLSEHVPVFAAARDGTGADAVVVQEADVARLADAQLADVEADAYWCLAKLLESVQDSYTSGQPGIHRALQKLQCLLHRLDGLQVPPLSLVSFALLIALGVFLMGVWGGKQNHWRDTWRPRGCSWCSLRSGG